MEMVVEEEIQQLAEKLEKIRKHLERKNLEARKYSNFDKQASLLRRRLEIFRGTSDKICVKEIQEMAEMSLSIKSKCRVNESLVSGDFSNVSTSFVLIYVVYSLSKSLFNWEILI